MDAGRPPSDASGQHVRGGGMFQVPRTFVHRWMMLGLVVLTMLLVPVAAIWLLQRRLVFQPDTSDPGPGAAAISGARDVWLHTGDGLRLAAWYLPAAVGCGTTVLVAPGNAGNRAGRAELARRLGERGLGVLLLEYRGYGGNPGSPTEKGLGMDAFAAWEFLHESLPADHHLVYFGESVGGGVVSTLSLVKPPDALVLRSPFIDLASAAGHHYPMLPVRIMLWDKFTVRSDVSKSTVPLTVILGERDTVIPPEQSLAVSGAAPAAATVIRVPGADHNDPELGYGPAVIDAVHRGMCRGT